MRVTPFSCGLPVILALAAIFSVGCARSQTPRFLYLDLDAARPGDLKA